MAEPDPAGGPIRGLRILVSIGENGEDAHADLGDQEAAREHWERACDRYHGLQLPEEALVTARLTRAAG